MYYHYLYFFGMTLIKQKEFMIDTFYCRNYCFYGTFSYYTSIFCIINYDVHCKVACTSYQMKLKYVRVSLLITITFVSFMIIPVVILTYYQYVG